MPQSLHVYDPACHGCPVVKSPSRHTSTTWRVIVGTVIGVLAWNVADDRATHGEVLQQLAEINNTRFRDSDALQVLEDVYVRLEQLENQVAKHHNESE